MGDELGDGPGRFRILNLGTTATLTLRRGMFCGKRRDQAHCHGGGSTQSSERPGKCLLIPNAVFNGYPGFRVVMVLGVGVERVAKINKFFLLVMSDFSTCSDFNFSDPEEMEQK